MTHVRTQILDAVADVLEASATELRGRVWRRRQMFPIEPADLPAIFIYRQGEPVRVEIMGRYYRDLEFVVAVVVRAFDDVERTADDISAIVEREIAAADLPVVNCVLTEVEFEYSGEGDQEFMAQRLIYSAEYQTTFNDPTLRV